MEGTLDVAHAGTRTGFLQRLARPFVNTWRFLHEVHHELQRVVWPSHEDTWTFTVIVMITIFIVGVWIGALDWIFANLVALLRLYS